MIPLPRAVIFDVDGTLADVSGIRHYVSPLAEGYRGYKNFDAFHAAASFAPANASVVTMAKVEHESGNKVIVVTSRRQHWEYRTRVWLGKHAIPFDALYMRGNGDTRPDYEVKRDILAQIRETYDPFLAYDDNPAVIRLWEEEGLGTIVVPGWLEEVAS